jgi:hypothetical protein
MAVPLSNANPDPFPDERRFSYNLYGVTVRTPWLLPYQETAAEREQIFEIMPAQASVFEGMRTAESQRRTWYDHRRLGDGAEYYSSPGILEMLTSPDGRRTLVRSLRGADDEPFLVCAVQFGVSFGLLKVGIEQLHATVIAAQGKAFAFLGYSGWGKSSLASTFLEAGFSVLTDDMLILKKAGDAFYPLPGPSHLKLYQDVAHSVLPDRVAGPGFTAVSDKAIIPLHREASLEKPVPLQCIYVLNRPGRTASGSRVTIRRVSKQQATLLLVRHPSNRVLPDSKRLALQFRQNAEIASVVPVKRLSYPRRFDFLPTVRDALLKDFQRV